MDIIHVTDSSFETEVLKSDVPVLVDFWAEWCGPCRMLEPVLHEAAENLPENRAKICKLNVDEYGELAALYSVTSIPTMIVFENGEEVRRSVGFQTKDDILALL